MKILITTDDGFDHPGHLSLKKILAGLGHQVWSVAPRHNQSGVGMKLTLGREVPFCQIGECDWVCDGTPVDCISFALHGLLPVKGFDAVVSGINAGANLSDDLWYSGTAAAAREAGKWQIPALALSYSYSSTPPYHRKVFEENDFSSFAFFLEQHLGNLLQACELHNLNANTENAHFSGFLNVNIPKNCNGEVCFASRFARRPYENQLQKNGDSYTLTGKLNAKYPLSAGVDAAADIEGKASISLTSFDSLQPLPFTLASTLAPGPSTLALGPSPRAEAAARRIMKSGISLLRANRL